MIPTYAYYLLSAGLFAIGLYGVLTQRSGIKILISIELLLNAANVNFVAFSGLHGNADGLTFALFSIALAAAEAAVGLAIFVNLYRLQGTIDVDTASALRW
ncbi:MAG: NADH-quinone oxidoreductase subunit NuoK [Methanobacteriota archaeon]